MRRTVAVLVLAVLSPTWIAAVVRAQEEPEPACPPAIGDLTLSSGWSTAPAEAGNRLWTCQYFVFDGDGEPGWPPFLLYARWSISATSLAVTSCSSMEDSPIRVVSGTRAAFVYWDDDPAYAAAARPAGEALLRQISPWAYACPGRASGDGDDEPAGDPSTDTTIPPSPDVEVDVAAAILDVLGGHANVDPNSTSANLFDTLGCTSDDSTCPAVDAARRDAAGFCDGLPTSATGADMIRRLNALGTLCEVALIGALRDTQGELIFPTMVAAMPVIASLASTAIAGTEDDLDVLSRFSNLLISLDGRNRGFTS